MEILEDSPSYKIITRRTDPDQPSRVLKSYHPDTNPHTADITCPDMVFPNEVETHSGALNFIYNSYNYYITPECQHAIEYFGYFNVKRNIYYDTLVFYNSLDNEPMPESLLTRIESLPNVVLCLVNYNHPVDNLPLSVRVLILEYYSNLPNSSALQYSRYSHSLNNLPINLEELILNVAYSGTLDYLPPNLINLQTSYRITTTMDNLPSGLLELKVPHHYKHPLENLPPLLESLIIDHEYYHPLRNLPATLKELDLGDNYYHELVELPDGLEELSLVSSPRNLKLPKCLKKLYIGMKCDWLSIAPNSKTPVSLETIHCSYYMIDIIIGLLEYEIPSNLKTIHLSSYCTCCNEIDDIDKEKKIKRIKESEDYKTLEDHLPADVQIIIRFDY